MKRLFIVLSASLLVFLGLPALAAQAKNYCIETDGHYVMKDLDPNDPEIANSVPIEKCDTPSPSPSYILVYPIRPKTIENTCTDNENVILPDVEGIDYTFLKNDLVEATPKFGYYFEPLSGDQTRFFKYTLKKAGEGLDCSPSPSPIVNSPSHDVVRPMPKPTELPKTGSSNSDNWLIVTGISALVLGVILYLVSFFLRRRRNY